VVKVDVQDVNDNWPIFSPSEYNVSIVWSPTEQGPIVTVRAKDADSGSFGIVSYYMISAKGMCHKNEIIIILSCAVFCCILY